MVFSASALISLIALLVYSGLLFIILRQDYKSRVHVWFSLYLLSMIVWSLGSLMLFVDKHYLGALFWNRFMLIGSMAMPIAFFGFLQEFLGKDLRNWLSFGIFVYLLAQVANAAGMIITSAMVVEGKLFFGYGPAIYAVSASWIFFTSFSTLILINEYRQAKDSTYRNRLKYLIFVIVLIYAGSATNLTALQVFPVDITFNVVAALLITYAILRFQLFDINLAIRKGMLYSIPTIIIGASYFLIISFAVRIFHGLSGTQIVLLSFSVAIVTALLVQPLQSKVQSWIDKVFFREKYDSFMMLQRISHTSAMVLDIYKLADMILNEVLTTFHVVRAGFFLKGEDGEFALIRGKGLEGDSNLKLRRDHPLVQQFVFRDRPLSQEEIEVLPQFRALWDQERDDLDRLGGELFVPVKVQRELVGIFVIGSKLSEETYTLDDQMTLTTMANQVAVAVENARLYASARQEIADRKRAEERLQLQLQRMSSLHLVDVTITSSVNLQVTLQVLLDVITSQLQVDAAAVLLLDPNTMNLEYTASRGFRTPALQHTRLSLGEGLAGRAALQQSIVRIKNLKEEPTSLEKSLQLAEENFVAYFGVPLLAKGRIKGVLEIFHRNQLDPDPEWINYLETLATEAAIAVDNAEMFNDLQRSNIELTQAYVTTLEGWSRALELRDRETEGHTRRVTELTIKLAHACGMNSDELVHVRRGALLHDIGKMGIPDSILLKPGPLTEQEWEIMCQHPVFAFKLLSTIPFLRPALDIPHYHHERWDGSGYPLGLRGEAIPLAARVFAVVDVWDALRSDRPYRPAWAEAEVLDYLRQQAGKLFDPQVVNIFLQKILEDPGFIEYALLMRETPLK